MATLEDHLARDDILQALDRDPASRALAAARRQELTSAFYAQREAGGPGHALMGGKDRAAGFPGAYGVTDLLRVQQELERLHADVAAGAEREARLAREVALATSRANEAETLANSLKEECESRAKDMAKAGAARLSAEKRCNVAEARVVALESSLAARERDFESLQATMQAALDRKSSELSEAQAQLAALSGEIRSLASSHDAKATELQQALAAARADAARLEDALRAAREATAEQAARAEKLTQAGGEYKKQRKAALAEAAELEELLGKSERARQEAEQKLAKVNARMERLVQEEEHTREYADREYALVDQIVSERNSLQVRLREATRGKKRAERRAATCEADCGNLANELRVRIEEVSGLEALTKDLERRHAEKTRALEHRVHVLTTQVQDLELAAEKQVKRHEILRREVTAEVEERCALESKQARLKLERQIQELELEVKRLTIADQGLAQDLFKEWMESKMDSLSRAQGDAVASQARGDLQLLMEQRVAALARGHVPAEEHEAACKRAEMSGRAAAEAEWRLRLQRAEDRLSDAAASASAEIGARVAEAERAVEARVRAAASASAEKAAAAHAAEMAEAERARKAAAARVAELSEQLEDVRGAQEDTEAQLQSTSRELDDARKLLAKHETAAVHAEQQHDRLAARIADLEKSAAALTARATAAESDLSDAAQRASRLETDLARAREELQDATARLRRAEEAAKEREEEQQAARAAEMEAVASDREALLAEAQALLDQVTMESRLRMGAVLEDCAAVHQRIESDLAAVGQALDRYNDCVRDKMSSSLLVESEASQEQVFSSISRAKRTLNDLDDIFGRELRSLRAAPAPGADDALARFSALPQPAAALASPAARPPPPATAVVGRALAPAAPAAAPAAPAALEALHREKRELLDAERALKKKVDDLQRSAEAERAKHAAAADASRRKLRALEEDLGAASADAARKGEVVARLETDLGAARGAAEDLRAQVAALEARAARSEEASGRALEAARRKLDDMAAELRRLKMEAQEQVAAMRGEVARVADELKTRLADAALAHESELQMAVLRARQEGDAAARDQLMALHHDTVQGLKESARQDKERSAAEAEALQRQVAELRSEAERVQPILEMCRNADDGEKTDMLLNSSLKIKELRTRLDDLANDVRRAKTERDSAQSTVQRLSKRIEAREEDIAIILLAIKGELGLDDGIAEGLLGPDKASFTQAVQELRYAIHGFVERRELQAAEDALSGKRMVANTALMTFKRERYDAFVADMNAAKAEVGRLERELAARQEQCDAADKERGELRDKLASRTQANADLETQLTQTKEEIRETRTLLDACRADLARTTEALERTKADLGGEAAARKAAEADLESTRSQLADTAAKLEAATAAVAELQAAQEASGRAHEDALTALRGENDVAVAELRARHDVELKSARAAVEQAAADVAELRREHQALADSAAREVAAVREAERAEAQHKLETAQHVNQSQHADEVARIVAQHADEAAALRERITSEVERARSECISLAEMSHAEALRPLRAEVARLREALDSVHTQRDADVAARDAEVEELRSRVQVLSDELEALRAKAARLQNQLSEEVTLGDKAREERGGLLTERDEMGARVKYLEGKVSRLMKEAASAGSELRQRTADVERLEQEVRMAKGRLRVSEDRSLGSIVPA
ncbi:unnamed protein product [Pedinophyceae sp. YPF-701]|nr:unnamed protein product [Pedinophyceae sp. YPF-701]